MCTLSSKTSLIIGGGLLMSVYVGLHFVAINKQSSHSSHFTNATNNETNGNESVSTSSVLSATYNDTLNGRSEIIQMDNDTVLVNDDGGTCWYFQEYSACVYQCSYMFNPGTELGPFIKNTENFLDCTIINVLIENSDFPHDTLSKGWLEYLGSKKIKQLWLKECNIKYIEDGALEGFEDLEKLYLENLLILELRSAQFKNLRGLKELYLNSFDNLHSIESQILSHFPKLETLQMSNFKGLELVLPNITGKEVKHMTSVDFRDNNIDILKPQYFEGLKNCAAFNLSRSNIKYIEPKTFYYPMTANSGKIDLSSNKLETLSEDAINFDRFTAINLQNNPWRCNCSLAWLAKMILNSNYAKRLEGDVVCKYPEELQGVKLSESGITESCFPSVSTSTTETTPTISTADTTSEMLSSTSTTVSTVNDDYINDDYNINDYMYDCINDYDYIFPNTMLEETTTTTTNTPDPTTSIVTTEKPSIITASSPDCPSPDNIVSTEKRTNQNFEVDEKEVGTLSVQIPSYANGWRLYLMEEDEDCWYSTTEEASVTFDLRLSEGQRYFICVLPWGRSPRNDYCQTHTMQLQEENVPLI